MNRVLDEIKSQLGNAIKEKDESSVSSLRFLLANIHNEEISKRRELADEELIALIRRQVKKNNESIAAFKKGGREDLVQKEEKEKAILESFLPAQLSDEDIRVVVKEIIGTGLVDFGQVMGQVMGRLKGQADGSEVARVVKEELHG
ncbi:MAG: GatB/YqeY domain-containing protein [bacterium]|nr:GatB/YqeY domain-containing protein [bacterium]